MKKEENRPLRKMTSAAYGVTGRLDCRDSRRGLPGVGFHLEREIVGSSAR